MTPARWYLFGSSATSLHLQYLLDNLLLLNQESSDNPAAVTLSDRAKQTNDTLHGMAVADVRTGVTYVNCNGKHDPQNPSPRHPNMYPLHC